MLTQWIGICHGQRLDLNGGLVLNIADHNELVITQPVELCRRSARAYPGEGVTLDPNDVPDETGVRLGHGPSRIRS